MIEFHEAGRLPAAGDNCAIATRTLPVGTIINAGDKRFALSHTILEGHRFAVQFIPAGAALLSWGMPFGQALRDIKRGEYLCNAAVLKALGIRALDFDLPTAPNFGDDFARFQFEIEAFRPAPVLPSNPDQRTFMGIRRPGTRGVGTRNTVVILGVNALVTGFVQRLENDVQRLAGEYSNIDDIVSVTHTEGSQAGGNNQTLLLRTLAGFMVHANVAAVLVLDAGSIGVTNQMLRDYAEQNGYPLDDVPHQFLTLGGPLEVDLERAARTIRKWLPEVDRKKRTLQPLGELKIALQCGGSDAFSGISGNPLAAWVSKEIIQSGGRVVLAETDELTGAEAYVLQKVRDAATVERFLAMSARFNEQATRHGHSAQGNVSGGNLYRGLYNIYLKSLGAATKRHPDVRLDYAIEYGERLSAPGYYFMDSPGNDLESIAGQVASGCNLIYFVTGNGSVTNFPFVPTIKIVTTSRRFDLLADEMDVNAGSYLEDRSLRELGSTTVDLTLAVASGQRSAGERADHSQVQIWRDWPLTEYIDIEQIWSLEQPDGQPLSIPAPGKITDSRWRALQTDSGISADCIGLVLPSSLCSAQIAQIGAQQLNKIAMGREKQISRFVALAHTEGCGNSTEPEYVDTMLGYMAHPMVATCLLLEHGCETTHNDFWRLQQKERGLHAEEFGWVSVQLDGGIKLALAKVEEWFAADCARLKAAKEITAGLGEVRMGIMVDGEVDEVTAEAMAQVVQQIVAAGGTVIMPGNDSLLTNITFTKSLQLDQEPRPTLAYAHQPAKAGVHIMANPTAQWSEIVTGLGAAGIELFVALVSARVQQSHPFIPMLQVTAQASGWQPFYADVDLILDGSVTQRTAHLLQSITAVLSRTHKPKASQANIIGFQITRGQLGVSL